MKIKQIELTNFRKFPHLQVSFDESITVIAALNGSGKSAVLDAVRAALWAFVRRIDAAAGSKPVGIQTDDVTLLEVNEQMEHQIPSAVKATTFEDNTWRIAREKTAPRTNTIYKQAKSIENLAKSLQQSVRDKDSETVNLPVLAFYGTGRLWHHKQFTKSRAKPDDSFFSRTYGYLDCLDEASSFKYFAQWFRWLFESHREEQIRSIEATNTVSDTRYQPYIRAIQAAIACVIESETHWGKIEYSASKKDVVLYHPEQGELKLSQLSDGVRNAVALVADIAYRCVKLNNHLKEEAPKLSEGIILIDEVDMHLHPSWQQRIVGQLQAAFPKLQFIVTTHSPQVLSTVNSESIRLLEEEQQDGQTLFVARTPAMQSLGVASSDILAELQGVDPVPDVEPARWLADYKRLITKGDYHSPESIELKEKIREHFGANHHEWLECERLIRLKTMKAKLATPEHTRDNQDKKEDRDA